MEFSQGKRINVNRKLNIIGMFSHDIISANFLISIYSNHSGVYLYIALWFWIMSIVP